MDAEEWNRRFPVGQAVIVTKANGQQLRTVTVAPAQRVGQFAMVAVGAIQPGTILLSWCRPFGAPPE